MSASSSPGRPFERRYGVTLAIALAALIPFILVNPKLRFDRSGVLLGVLGTALPFWAVGSLTLHKFASASPSR